MKPLVIFGCGELAQLAHAFFCADSPRHVVGFVVDEAYHSVDSFCGLPLIPFGKMTKAFPPAEFDAFIAVGYSGLNQERTRKFKALKDLGYEFASYVSSFSNIWPGTGIGSNCLVMEGNTIQPFVEIADNVIIWSGSLLSHHVVVEEGAFIGSQVVVSGGVRVGARSFIGVNATIREHICIGKDCLIGAAAVILKDTADGSSYLVGGTPDSGIPAHRLRGLL